MTWQQANKKLKAMWPGVSPGPVVAVLFDGSPSDSAVVDAVLDPVLSGPDTATRLMGPIAATLDARSPQDQIQVLHALDALISAGGDPTEVLSSVAKAMAQKETTQSAAGVLRTAALRGWSLASICEQLPFADSEQNEVRQVHRLAALQRRGQIAEFRRLATIYAALSPMSTLHGCVGLVEEGLLSDELSEVRAAQTVLGTGERGLGPVPLLGRHAAHAHSPPWLVPLSPV